VIFLVLYRLQTLNRVSFYSGNTLSACLNTLFPENQYLKNHGNHFKRLKQLDIRII